MPDSAIALLDAATAHGAARCLNAIRGRPLPHLGAGSRSESYDVEHFVDFLHHLLLYDDVRIVSSPFNHEVGVDDLVMDLNTLLGEQLLSVRDPRTTDDWGRPGIDDAVVDGICALVRDLSVRDPSFRTRLGHVPVPHLYQGTDHVDHPRFVAASRRCHLEADLVPLAMFAYRGACYAASARALAATSPAPVAYVASPGRLQALMTVFPSEDWTTFEYPSSGYRDLLTVLRLPPSGYDFSFLSSMPPHRVSAVNVEIRTRTPLEALHWVAEQRSRPEGRDLVARWREQLSTAQQSGMVGHGFRSSRDSGIEAYARLAYARARD